VALLCRSAIRCDHERPDPATDRAEQSLRELDSASPHRWRRPKPDRQNRALDGMARLSKLRCGLFDSIREPCRVPSGFLGDDDGALPGVVSVHPRRPSRSLFQHDHPAWRRLARGALRKSIGTGRARRLRRRSGVLLVTHHRLLQERWVRMLHAATLVPTNGAWPPCPIALVNCGPPHMDWRRTLGMPIACIRPGPVVPQLGRARAGHIRISPPALARARPSRVATILRDTCPPTA